MNKILKKDRVVLRNKKYIINHREFQVEICINLNR